MGKGVRVRVGTNVRVGVRVRRTEEQWREKGKKSEENTTVKGQNIFI